MARVLPEARRPGICQSMVWLRFWSPSTIRVRSLLLWVVLEEYCRAQSSSLCVARVSPGARRPGACRSMVWLRFGSPSTTRVRSQLFGVVLEAYCRACTILLFCMWHAFRLGLAGLARAGRWFGFGFGHRAPRGYEASSLCLFLRSIVKQVQSSSFV